MTVVELRAAQAADLGAIGALTVEVYRPLLPPGDPYLLRLADVRKRFERAEVVVATVDGAVVGSLTMAEHGTRFADVAREGELEFRMLAVSTQARGLGVGSGLVAYVLGQARARGRSAVVISTMPNMVAARRIYDRLGFVRVPERDWSPEPGLIITVLRLALEDTLG